MTVSGIEIAPLESADELAVGSLFRNQGMKFAGLTLNYDRGAEFRRLLGFQAPRHQTYLAKEKSELRSLISLASGPRWFNGEIREVAFVSDFRIDHSPRARLVWRDLLDQVVRDFDDETGVRRPSLLFALVLKGNKAALRSFTESKRTTQFQMREVGSVRMINIFARLPHFSRITRNLRTKKSTVSRALSTDRVELIDFLKKSERCRQLGYVFGNTEFCEAEFRHRNWNFRWEDFLLQRENGKISACVLPWAPDSDTKVMTFTAAPKFFEAGLSVLARIGLKVPRRHEPIKTLYLTHLNVSNRAKADGAIAQFLEFIYSERLNSGYQMVSFPDWWKLGKKSKSLMATIHQKVDVGIYSVGVAGHELVEVPANQIFNFEMAVI
ncbi:hypothetical protein BH10BDE1_BH10BDE1_05090 [soil metagenome]